MRLIHMLTLLMGLTTALTACQGEPYPSSSEFLGGD